MQTKASLLRLPARSRCHWHTTQHKVGFQGAVCVASAKATPAGVARTQHNPQKNVCKVPFVCIAR